MYLDYIHKINGDCVIDDDFDKLCNSIITDNDIVDLEQLMTQVHNVDTLISAFEKTNLFDKLNDLKTKSSDNTNVYYEKRFLQLWKEISDKIYKLKSSPYHFNVDRLLVLNSNLTTYTFLKDNDDRLTIELNIEHRQRRYHITPSF